MKKDLFIRFGLLLLAACTTQGPGAECTGMGGEWLEPYSECEGISEEQCGQLGGEYDSCASACRNDPDAEVCTMQCVQVCKTS